MKHSSINVNKVCLSINAIVVVQAYMFLKMSFDDNKENTRKACYARGMVLSYK